MNVALNKPSFQVSTYGNHNASLGNDGDLYSGHFVRSRSAADPWWAVDLGQPTVVYGVNLTNVRPGTGRPNIIACNFSENLVVRLSLFLSVGHGSIPFTGFICLSVFMF